MEKKEKRRKEGNRGWEEEGKERGVRYKYMPEMQKCIGVRGRIDMIKMLKDKKWRSELVYNCPRAERWSPVRES